MTVKTLNSKNYFSKPYKHHPYKIVKHTQRVLLINNRRIVWVCLTNLWGWHLKG